MGTRQEGVGKFGWIGAILLEPCLMFRGGYLGAQKDQRPQSWRQSPAWV